MHWVRVHQTDSGREFLGFLNLHLRYTALGLPGIVGLISLGHDGMEGKAKNVYKVTF